MRWRMLVIVAVGLLMPTSPAKANDAKKDEKLRSTWVVVSAECNGKSAESSKGDQFTFSADKVTVKTKVKTSKHQPYIVDTSKTPKEIDITDGQGKSLGIYELDGDSLKLCYWPGERPSEFTSKSALLLVLKRHKAQ